MTSADAVHDLTAALDALLPQTQCGQCGYAGCRPYAAAMAAGGVDFNRCPPGGMEVIAELALLLERAPKPLDTSYGYTKAPAVAIIDEAWCIGCTLCIQACPVDAIAGAAKLMHTVIAEECTGCELCIAPCPVDCIQMVALEQPGDRDPGTARTVRIARAADARSRYLAKHKRSAKEKPKQIQRTSLSESLNATADDDKKQSAIARALARARKRIDNQV